MRKCLLSWVDLMSRRKPAESALQLYLSSLNVFVCVLHLCTYTMHACVLHKCVSECVIKCELWVVCIWNQGSEERVTVSSALNIFQCMGLGLTSPMPWDPLGADLEWFSVQLYLPSSRLMSWYWRAGTVMLGQLNQKESISFSATGCPQPGSCMMPGTGSHSQPVEGDN